MPERDSRIDDVRAQLEREIVEFIASIIKSDQTSLERLSAMIAEKVNAVAISRLPDVIARKLKAEIDATGLAGLPEAFARQLDSNFANAWITDFSAIVGTTVKAQLDAAGIGGLGNTIAGLPAAVSMVLRNELAQAGLVGLPEAIAAQLDRPRDTADISTRVTEQLKDDGVVVLASDREMLARIEAAVNQQHGSVGTTGPIAPAAPPEGDAPPEPVGDHASAGQPSALPAEPGPARIKMLPLLARSMWMVSAAMFATGLILTVMATSVFMWTVTGLNGWPTSASTSTVASTKPDSAAQELREDDEHLVALAGKIEAALGCDPAAQAPVGRREAMKRIAACLAQPRS